MDIITFIILVYFAAHRLSSIKHFIYISYWIALSLAIWRFENWEKILHFDVDVQWSVNQYILWQFQAKDIQTSQPKQKKTRNGSNDAKTHFKWNYQIVESKFKKSIFVAQCKKNCGQWSKMLKNGSKLFSIRTKNVLQISYKNTSKCLEYNSKRGGETIYHLILSKNSIDHIASIRFLICS